MPEPEGEGEDMPEPRYIGKRSAEPEPESEPEGEFAPAPKMMFKRSAEPEAESEKDEYSKYKLIFL